ncbi:MAG: serine/threonine-protein phosphatase [Planctomycetes bacterium]|nr:serine/threonine-protein phosphatase [Planctomycetota bacterium]
MSTLTPASSPGLLVYLQAELAAIQREMERREGTRQADLELAARVHESLLPRPVHHPRIDVDTRYVPVEGVGGDYCQVLFPDESCCYITMCDVTGHGIGPALLATRVSSEVRHLAFDRRRPMEIVQDLNAFVNHHFRDTELQLSFFAAQFDLTQRTIRYSGAGHPSPLLIRQGAGPIERLASQNLLIGVAENCLDDQPEHATQLHPGDRLVFFTDGLTETTGVEGKRLGQAGLAEIAARTCAGSLFEMADCILGRIDRFRVGPVRDDMTLIIAELK